MRDHVSLSSVKIVGGCLDASSCGTHRLPYNGTTVSCLSCATHHYKPFCPTATSTNTHHCTHHICHGRDIKKITIRQCGRQDSDSGGLVKLFRSNYCSKIGTAPLAQLCSELGIAMMTFLDQLLKRQQLLFCAQHLSSLSFQAEMRQPGLPLMI